jgi:hypothetical protein
MQRLWLPKLLRRLIFFFRRSIWLSSIIFIPTLASLLDQAKSIFAQFVITNAKPLASNVMANWQNVLNVGTTLLKRITESTIPPPGQQLDFFP